MQGCGAFVQRAPPHSEVQLQTKPTLAAPNIPPADRRRWFAAAPAAVLTLPAGEDALTGTQSPPFSQGGGVPTASQIWCSHIVPRHPTLQAQLNVGSTPCRALVHDRSQCKAIWAGRWSPHLHSVLASPPVLARRREARWLPGAVATGPSSRTVAGVEASTVHAAPTILAGRRRALVYVNLAVVS